MLLNEFFGNPVKLGKKDQGGKDIESDGHKDDLFWFIVDHDRLHKDFFHPIANKIKKHHDEDKLNRSDLIKEFLPMVNKGCKEFYEKHKMMGNLGEIFPKDMREDLCERLYDHYAEDVIKAKEYKL